LTNLKPTGIRGEKPILIARIAVKLGTDIEREILVDRVQQNPIRSILLGVDCPYQKGC
jgi:hypothetical protein